jgi:hypothetical protein
MEGGYHLEGDWGRVDVTSAPPALVFDDKQS